MSERTTKDVATLIYSALEKDGPFRSCNLARRVGLKQSTVRSFLTRMEKVGSVKRDWMLWSLSDDFRARIKKGEGDE
jgi:Mn-dependent DtxR family transcriptional regulator